jgi:hypothetical protein
MIVALAIPQPHFLPAQRLCTIPLRTLLMGVMQILIRKQSKKPVSHCTNGLDGQMQSGSDKGIVGEGYNPA